MISSQIDKILGSIKTTKFKVFAVYYFGWFAAVGAGGLQHDWVAILTGCLTTLILQKIVRLHKTDFILAIKICFLGLILEQTLFSLGLIQFKTQNSINSKVIPFWMISVWWVFSICSIYSVELLPRRNFVLGTLGTIVGPLSYLFGEKIGLLELKGANSIYIYAVFWFVMLPLTAKLIRRFK